MVLRSFRRPHEAGGSHAQRIETRFIVYRDLRQRGYVVKNDSGELNFRLYPRGGTPTTTQTNLWVLAISERDIFNIVELMRQADMSQRTRKELLLAVVDEEGDITYYTAENADPKGELNDNAMKEVPEGLLMEGSILVLDESHGTKLYQYGFYGKKIGKMLQLSFIETAYLIEHGQLSLRAVGTGRKMAERTFLKRAKEIQPDFDMRLLAYSDLRSRKLVVKTGFKYGTHFRVYKGDPSSHHSEYLVHAVPDNYSTVWAEISRAIRLAHGVKKDILFAASFKRRHRLHEAEESKAMNGTAVPTFELPADLSFLMSSMTFLAPAQSSGSISKDASSNFMASSFLPVLLRITAILTMKLVRLRLNSVNWTAFL